MIRTTAGLVTVLMLLAGPTAAQIAPPTPDVDGDGSTDFLFARSNLDSYMTIWRMHGVVQHAITTPDPDHPIDANWNVSCLADFNAQGWADILWRNTTSGKMVVWTMRWRASDQRYEKITGFFIEPLPADAGMISNLDWQIVACPDMGSMAPGAGSPDHTPDGKVDILWQNRVTREIKIWYMLNFTEKNSFNTSPSGTIDLNWELIAAREFGTSSSNSAPDGHPDLLFQNTSSKKVVVWFMDGHVRTGAAFTNPDGPIDLNWNVTGAGDLGTSSTNIALDGKADIIFRNANSGGIVVWLMNGINRTEGLFTTPSAEPDLTRILIAPR